MTPAATSELRALAELDRTIHEPARLMVVSLLFLTREADFLWLLNQTGLTKGNLSVHLSKLETAGYVEVEKRFRGKIPQTLFRLTRSGRKEFDAYRRALKTALG